MNEDGGAVALVDDQVWVPREEDERQARQVGAAMAQAGMGRQRLEFRKKFVFDGEGERVTALLGEVCGDFGQIVNGRGCKPVEAHCADLALRAASSARASSGLYVSPR